MSPQQKIEALAAPVSRPPVLCVDLDGTLIKSNTLAEACFALLRVEPWLLGAMFLWLLRGQAFLWQQVAARTPLNVSLLPIRPEVMAMISLRQSEGGRVVLVTGCHEILATRVAEHLRCFSEVFATNGTTHLVGKSKATLLKEQFGEGGFDYIGDDTKDHAIWSIARQKFVVGRYRPAKVEKLDQASNATLLKSLWRALRPHQWVKNGLVYLPLLLSHRYQEGKVLWETTLAAVLFSLASSSVYLWNDLLDLEADRRHPLKKNRPLASSDIPIALAIPLSFGLAATALIGAWILSPTLALVIATYIATSSAYSLWIKKLLIVDVVVLACLYVIRLVAGGVATGIPLSFWTLAFSLFFFFSLALAKRYSELRNRGNRSDEFGHGRAYTVPDLVQVNILGIASGLVAVCFVGLYINGNEVRQLYSRPDLLWAICPLILDWCSRLWILAGRGELHEDPVVFAFRDRRSYITGVLLVLVVAAAI